MRWHQLILIVFVLKAFFLQTVLAEDVKNIQNGVSGSENSSSDAVGNYEGEEAELLELPAVNSNGIASNDTNDYSDSLMKVNMQVPPSHPSAAISPGSSERQLDGMDINRFLPKVPKKDKTEEKNIKKREQKKIPEQNNKDQNREQPEKNYNEEIPRMKNPKTLADLFGGNDIRYAGKLLDRNGCVPCVNHNAGMKKSKNQPNNDVKPGQMKVKK